MGESQTLIMKKYNEKSHWNQMTVEKDCLSPSLSLARIVSRKQYLCMLGQGEAKIVSRKHYLSCWDREKPKVKDCVDYFGEYESSRDELQGCSPSVTARI